MPIKVIVCFSLSCFCLNHWFIIGFRLVTGFTCQAAKRVHYTLETPFFGWQKYKKMENRPELGCRIFLSISWKIRTFADEKRENLSPFFRLAERTTPRQFVELKKSFSMRKSIIAMAILAIMVSTTFMSCNSQAQEKESITWCLWRFQMADTM